MTKKEIEEKTQSLAEPLAKELGLWLVDTEYVTEHGEKYLRIFIDKPGGVTIDDCVDLTRPMNDILDKNDFIKEAYIFEVSSPGLDRPLSKDIDFIRCMEKDIEIRLYAPLEGTKEFTGKLTGYDKDTITISEGDKELTLSRDKIAIIKQAIIF